MSAIGRSRSGHNKIRPFRDNFLSTMRHGVREKGYFYQFGDCVNSCLFVCSRTICFVKSVDRQPSCA